MTELLEQALATARRLSPEMQDEAARMLLAFFGEPQPVCQFTPEEEAEQDEADAAEARGDCATDEDMRAVWAKYGL